MLLNNNSKGGKAMLGSVLLVGILPIVGAWLCFGLFSVVVVKSL
jgi:hypothetical protein